MIQLVIPKRWQNDPLDVAKRIAAIVVGPFQVNDQVPYVKSQGGFVLDIGNDWFLNFVDENNEVAKLSYRYDAPENITLEQWIALKTVIEWALR